MMKNYDRVGPNSHLVTRDLEVSLTKVYGRVYAVTLALAYYQY